MQAVFGQVNESTLTLGATFLGRLGAAVERFFWAVVLLSIGGTIFYLPDYLGDYRAEEPMEGFLAAALVITAVFIGLVAGALRFLRRDVWVVDADDGVLVYQASRVLRRGYEHTDIDLSHVERFIINVRGPVQGSRLLVELDDHGGERMLSTRFGGQDLAELAETLRDFLDAHDLQIAVDAAG